MKTYPLLIGGELRESSERDIIRNPFDGAVVGEVHVGAADDMDDAIAAAHQAVQQMRQMPTHQRAAILDGTAARLRDRGDELSELMARESGKPIRYCRGEVRRAVVTFTLAAGETRRENGHVMPIDLEPRAEGRLCLYTRVPRGPVAAISPFNFPLNLIAHKLAPAVAVGASVVLKPPPQCPITGLTLAEMMLEAGLPPKALSVVHCGPEVAQRMVEDDRMKVLSFTGVMWSDGSSRR